MTTHQSLSRRRQWLRDAAEMPRWVFGVVVLTMFAAFTAVLGVGLLTGGSRVGVFVLLGGAAVVLITVAYWAEGRINGIHQTAGPSQHVPDRVGSPLHRGLRRMRPADGPEAEGHGESGVGTLVCPGGRHRAVRRVPVAPTSHRVIGHIVGRGGRGNTSASTETSRTHGSGDVAPVA